jgi:hypothetical protein
MSVLGTQTGSDDITGRSGPAAADTSQQIHHNKYITTDTSQQIHHNRYITTDTSQQIHHNK